MELINLFTEKLRCTQACNWDTGLQAAIQYNNRDLVDFFLKQHISYWNLAIQRAAKYGNKEFVELLIEQTRAHKIAIDWDNGLISAAEGGSTEIVDIFISNNPTSWNMSACRASSKGDKNMVEYLAERGNVWCWNDVLKSAVHNNHQDIVIFCVNKGALPSNK